MAEAKDGQNKGFLRRFRELEQEWEAALKFTGASQIEALQRCQEKSMALKNFPH